MTDDIERIQMNEQDELLYRIKYGHAPGQRLDKCYREIDGEKEIYYVLTNIPQEKGGEI